VPDEERPLEAERKQLDEAAGAWLVGGLELGVEPLDRGVEVPVGAAGQGELDRKSTRLNSSHQR